MTSITNIRESIFSINDDFTFNKVALEIFHFQATYNEVYRRYIDLLKINIDEITHYSKIPFLPIEFFKSNVVISSVDKNPMPEIVFKSSGTTGQNTSTHYLLDTGIYFESFTKGFHYFYGDLKEWNILALLPSYLERKDSSLVYMVDHWMRLSNKEANQFYLYEHQALYEHLKALEIKQEKSLLIGVSYALLDFMEAYQLPLHHCIVMETGGMKGKRAEISKFELHEHLQKAFSIPHIHAEYGMTELLSQAYSKGQGIYACPPWMKVICTELNDPFQSSAFHTNGRINIIDLANLYSCSFIETADMGKLHPNGHFEIIGRMENAILRGCNLLID